MLYLRAVSEQIYRAMSSALDQSIVCHMWRLHVLARFLSWYDLLGVGVAMLDGSYWKTSIYDDRDFLPPAESGAAFEGGD